MTADHDLPMPPDRYAELVARRRAVSPPDPLVTVPRREPATATSELAAELLTEAAGRSLESGELLLVSEEATLADLERAADTVELVPALPAMPDGDALLAVLATPRLLNPRVWEALGWQPPLAEHLRLLEAALLGGQVVPQTMLVGHVETFPERVEHLVRLRHLHEAARDARGGVVVAIAVAGPEQLPAVTPRLERILDAARPAAPDTDQRHALALARLALGGGVVVGASS
jgi:hypothetical protein